MPLFPKDPTRAPATVLSQQEREEYASLFTQSAPSNHMSFKELMDHQARQQMGSAHEGQGPAPEGQRAIYLGDTNAIKMGPTGQTQMAVGSNSILAGI